MDRLSLHFSSTDTILHLVEKVFRYLMSTTFYNSESSTCFSSFILYFLLKLGQIFSGDEKCNSGLSSSRCNSGLSSVVLSDCPRGSCQLSTKAGWLCLECSIFAVLMHVFIGAHEHICVWDLCLYWGLKVGNRSQDARAVHSQPLLPGQGVRMCCCRSVTGPFAVGKRGGLLLPTSILCYWFSSQVIVFIWTAVVGQHAGSQCLACLCAKPTAVATTEVLMCDCHLSVAGMWAQIECESCSRAVFCLGLAFPCAAWDVLGCLCHWNRNLFTRLLPPYLNLQSAFPECAGAWDYSSWHAGLSTALISTLWGTCWPISPACWGSPELSTHPSGSINCSFWFDYSLSFLSVDTA